MGVHALADDEFLFGWCDRCGTEVLTHCAAADDQPEEPLCVRCDAPVRAALRIGTSEELESRGYEIYAERGGGCGGGGCGSGGCGRA